MAPLQQKPLKLEIEKTKLHAYAVGSKLSVSSLKPNSTSFLNSTTIFIFFNFSIASSSNTEIERNGERRRSEEGGIGGGGGRQRQRKPIRFEMGHGSASHQRPGSHSASRQTETLLRREFQ